MWMEHNFTYVSKIWKQFKAAESTDINGYRMDNVITCRMILLWMSPCLFDSDFIFSVGFIISVHQVFSPISILTWYEEEIETHHLFYLYTSCCHLDVYVTGVQVDIRNAVTWFKTSFHNSVRWIICSVLIWLCLWRFSKELHVVCYKELYHGGYKLISTDCDTVVTSDRSSRLILNQYSLVSDHWNMFDLWIERK